MTTNIKLQALTVDQVLNHSKREYNPSEWNNKIAMMNRFKNVQFYLESAETSVNDYDTIWCVYTIPEGITLMGEVSYHSCLHNGGFCIVCIDDDGTVRKYLAVDKEGKEGYLQNCQQNRKVMAFKSKNFGTIYSSSI